MGAAQGRRRSRIHRVDGRRQPAPCVLPRVPIRQGGADGSSRNVAQARQGPLATTWPTRITGSRQNGMQRARIVCVVIRLVNPSKPPSINDHPLWTLHRGERRAHAVAREVRGVGIELVINIDGELRWSQLYRDGVGFGIAAAEQRQALVDTGWLEVSAS
jgi:hypothetical protein